uniref:IS701 family transposase n=1 Tax=Streptomyces spongiae TaxID=565072 RepID=UPI002AD27390|nr:IS701 family transposase [Streptomyces spongiae]
MHHSSGRDPATWGPTDTASCPLEWELFLPEEWAGDARRRQQARVPDEVGHVSRTQLALGLLDRLAARLPTVPVIAADAGYGRSVSFRLALEERGRSYVMAVDPKEIARPAVAEPYQPAYAGLGPPTLPRYRERTAQELGGGRNRWDGVLPLRTLLVEQPERAAEPTGYWMTNLPATTPVADMVRWAKMRWRIEHDYRELKHGLGLDHFEGRTWRGWHHHVTLATAAHAFLTTGRSRT